MIYLIRHGQTFNNIKGIIGGDSSLTDLGRSQVKNVVEFLSVANITKIFHSDTVRGKESSTIAGKILTNANCVLVPELNEISGGKMDNLTYSQIEKEYPDVFEEREKDKFNFTYPEGESYKSVMKRVSPFVSKIVSSKENILIVGHRAINRIILGLLLNLKEDILVSLAIPNDVVFQFNPLNKTIFHIQNGFKRRGFNLEDQIISKF